MKDPQTTTYPNDSNGFKIIHPLYDRYSEHIELVGDVLYRGKINKGIFTINTCHLYRVGLAEERVDQKMYAENKGSIVAEMIRLSTLSREYVDNVEEFVDYVKDLVRRYKEKGEGAENLSVN